MDDLAKQLRAILEQGLSDEATAKIRKQITDIMEEVQCNLDYAIKDDLAHNLAAHVQDMAEHAVKSLLEGNEFMMREYLNCPANGGYNGREHKACVIRGSLFESDPIALRRKICDAHQDMLKNERILDLEAQLANLTSSNARLQEQIDGIRRGVSS